MGKLSKVFVGLAYGAAAVSLALGFYESMPITSMMMLAIIVSLVAAFIPQIPVSRGITIAAAVYQIVQVPNFEYTHTILAAVTAVFALIDLIASVIYISKMRKKQAAYQAKRAAEQQ